MAKGKILETIIDISGEISPTLGKSLKSVTSQLSGIKGQALAVGSAVTAIGVGTAVAVGKSVKYLADLGDTYNQAMNDIEASTGLAGHQLDEMNNVLKEVYGSNFGDSMEDAADGITSVYEATGLAGKYLEETTKGAFLLRDTFGYDIPESARAAKAMMGAFDVSGEDAMSMIAAGAQNGLDYSGELIDSINEYSVQFAKLGFTADDMFNIFQQGADSGAWNLDKVGDAVKEFSIRSIDGSKTTTEAFEALGYNADEMMQVFANGGDDASEAFQDVIGNLMDMDDKVQRDAVGVKLFGTMWEDLGTGAIESLSQIDDGVYDTKHALDSINEVRFNNIGDAIQGIKRQAEVSLLPMATTIANAFMDIAPVIGDLFEDLGPLIEQVTEEAMPFVDEFLDGIMDLLPVIMPMISDLADALLPMLSTFLGELLPPLLDLIQQLIPPFLEIVEAIMPALTEVLLAVLPMLTQIIDMILPVAVQLIQSLLPVIQPLLEILSTLFTTVIMPLLGPLLQLVQAILPAIQPLLSVICTALQPVCDILGVLADVLGTVIGFISKVVGWVADGLTWVVDLVIGDSGVSGYATGGFTDGVSIAGEDPRYPTEAVLSFNPAYRRQNLSYWAEAGRMLGADASDFSLSAGDSSTSYFTGSITFAPNITVQGNADKQTIMDAIEDEYPEFCDLMDRYFAEKGVPQ